MILYFPGKLVDDALRDLSARTVDALADAEREYRRTRYDIQKQHARAAEDAVYAWTRAFERAE